MYTLQSKAHCGAFFKQGYKDLLPSGLSVLASHTAQLPHCLRLLGSSLTFWRWYLEPGAVILLTRRGLCCPALHICCHWTVLVRPLFAQGAWAVPDWSVRPWCGAYTLLVTDFYLLAVGSWVQIPPMSTWRRKINCR